MPLRAYLGRSHDSLADIARYLKTDVDRLKDLNSHFGIEEVLSGGELLAVPSGPSKRIRSLHAHLARLNANAFGALDTDPDWLKVAFREEGQRESAVGDNPRIIEYLHTVTTLPRHLRGRDETPWCACFAQWCLAQAGVKGRDSARALDWRSWGRSASIERGAIAVFERHNNGVPAGGHVGFVLNDRGDAIELLGGNQGNAVSRDDYPKAGAKRDFNYTFIGCRTAA